METMKREDLRFVAPGDIEKRSFEIIESELNEHNIILDERTAHIVKRVIHTTADFSYADNMYFSNDFDVRIGELIRSGDLTIITDTNMALSGISKAALNTVGGSARCFMSDEAIAAEAKERGITRASVSMEYAAAHFTHPFFVIGNAPTALITIYDLYRSGKVDPAFIIAAPVGFVNVIEAKELIETLPVPMIVSRGRKGGSNIAAAIVNALLYHAIRS